MTSYKDADAILAHLPDDLPYKAAVRRVLLQAPAADVVEVVRCEKCIHRKKITVPDRGRVEYCEYTWIFLSARDYCSLGERKEGEK